MNKQVSLQKKEYLKSLLNTAVVRLHEADSDETVIKILETVAAVCVNQANNVRRKLKASDKLEHLE